MNIYIYIHTYMYAYVYTYMYSICIYIHMYKYVYTYNPTFISSISCLPPYTDRMLCIIVQTRYIHIGCHNSPCVLIQSHLHLVFSSSAILHKPYAVHRIPGTIHSYRVS